MLETTKKRKEANKIVFALAVMSVFVFFRFYDATVDLYNTTLLAFSYKYGFISRGLIGTVFQFINSILPVDMMNYGGALLFTQVATAVFLFILFGFFWQCLRRADEKMTHFLAYTELFLAIIAVSMFVSRRNMGRVDIYMIALSLIGAMLIIRGKFEFLLVPISALAVMFHQGYVFMFFNVLLVLLIYRFFSVEKKEKKKYLIIFVLSFCIGSALFLWFEFFSRMNGEQFVDEIITNSKLLSYNGEYHDTLIDHEILGIDLGGTEWDFHKENFVEYPIYLLFMMPYIWIGVRLFGGFVKAARTKEEKWKYIFVAIGSLTIVPNYILKIDYARWTMSIVVYYVAMLLSMLAMKDEVVEGVCGSVFVEIKKKAWAPLLFAYLILFMPFYDVFVNQVMHNIGHFLNVNWLHLWEHY
jgi:hypothetical protein